LLRSLGRGAGPAPLLRGLMKPFHLLAGALALAALAGAGLWAYRHRGPAPPGEPPSEPWFADVTEEVGLHFVHDAGPVGDYFMPQALGSGAAVFDFDGDGRLDVLLFQNGGPKGKKNQLFRQLPDGTFQDVSAGSGLDFAGHNMGVAVGDVNNDGLPDVLVTQYGGVKLLLNNGDGTFTDVTKESGLGSPGWGASAAFFDYDRDGWLDLVVVQYVDYDPTWPCTDGSGAREYCPPKTFPGQVTRLFRNLGKVVGRPGVRFQDVTVASGLGAQTGPGLGVVCADFDGDGWPDLFVANDGAPNHLWVNQVGRPDRKKEDPFFKEEGVRRGLAYNAMGQAEAGMGIALGDVDGDGLFEVFVTHLTEETHTLWGQGPRGLFRDRTAEAGLAAPRRRGTGFGTALADFDHDGAPDAAVANGRIARGPRLANPALGDHWGWYAERNQLFANDGTGKFRDISPSNGPFCGTPNVARGLACADVDGDGALDLLVTTAAGRARLYKNVAPRRGHWLMVRALDPARKRDAYGAEVTVRAGGRARVGLVQPASSYLCSNDARAHFGLGKCATVDAITVRWPDGTRETFAGGPADRVVELRKGHGLRGEEGGR
jgi:enediyne biosynthesis protein E4